MRCRRVRFFLSAYCNNELPEKRHGVISQHLENCSACRREEVAYRELGAAVKNTIQYKIPSDFNTKLLNRITEERYKETRTKAYIPKGAPLVNLNRVLPIVAVACLAVAFIFAGGIDKLMERNDVMMVTTEMTSPNNLDNSYMTVQPSNDHVLAKNNEYGWAFNKQLARAARFRKLSEQVTSQTHFSSFASQAAGNRLRSFEPVFIIPRLIDGRKPFIEYYFPNLIRAGEVNAGS